MSSQGPNIFLAAIIRSTDKCVIASFLRSKEVTVEGVRECIAGNANMVRGKRYSAQGSTQVIHYTLDPHGRTFCLVTSPRYPMRLAFGALDEMQDLFGKELGLKAASATEGSLSRPASSMFKFICDKYENPARIDKLTAVQEKVDVIKTTMKDSIQQMLINTEQLETIERKTEDLSRDADQFRGRTKELRDKMWWKMWKMRLLIGGLVIAVLIIIIVPLAVSSSNCSKGSSCGK